MNGFEKRSLAKKKLVLAATYELMNTPRGVAGLTIDEIVKKTKISKATIFKYFGSKNHLVQQVFADFFAKMADQARETMAKQLSFEEKMYEFVDIKVAQLAQVDYQFFLDLMQYYTQTADQKFAAVMKHFTEESFEIMRELFHQGRQEGKIDPQYSDDFLMLFFESLTAGVSQPEIYQRLDYTFTAPWTEIILKGIAPVEKNKH